MTREEAKQEFWRVSKSGGYTGVFERAFNIKFNDVLKMPYHGSEFDKFIDKIFDSLESKIEELEMIIKGKDAIIEAMVDPKDCLGCKWLSSTGKTTKEYCHKCSVFWDSNYTKRDAK